MFRDIDGADPPSEEGGQDRVVPISGSQVGIGENGQFAIFQERAQRPTLRPYQSDCLEALQAAVAAGTSALGVIPTGGGKSLVLAALMADMAASGRRALLLTHVRELIEQNSRTFGWCAPDVPYGIFCRGLKQFDLESPVIFAQTQTLYARRHLLTEPFDVVVIDECHRIPFAGEGMYVKLMRMLRELRPSTVIAGFTATPFRLHGRRLDMGPDAWFSETAYEIGVTALIDQGYLAPLIGKKPAGAQINTDGLKIERGDFREGDLADAVDDDDLNQRIVDEIIRCGTDRRSWLVFAVGVDHAKVLLGMLAERDIVAGMVLGETPSVERDETIARFRDGSLRALVNVGCLTTGFDHPELDLIAVVRPTNSASLHVQMLGRGTRLAEFKGNCLVLDFAGNVARLGPISAPRLCFAKTSKWETAGKGGVVESPACPRCDTYFDEPPNDRVCPSCGYAVPEPVIIPPAHNFDEVEPLHDVPLRVIQHRVWPHHKPGRPSSIKISYRLQGGMWASEYLCLFHGGFPARKAKEAWRMRGGGRCPDTLEEAVQRANHLLMPLFVSVDTSRGFPIANPRWDLSAEAA